MTTTAASALSIVGGLVMNSAGRFSPRTVTIADGRFGDVDGPGAEVLDARGLWVLPGVYDCHSHVTWSDFHPEERARKSEQQRATETADALLATLRSGVTSLRDAGGADARLRSAVDAGELPGPRLQISIDMIGPGQPPTADSMRARVESTLQKGAQWIKLMGTGGVATPEASALSSILSETEIRTAVEVAHSAGARVMIHTWGGESVDWAIEHGVTSIEHGIYMTSAQVSAAAAAGMTLVPTVTIYRLVRDMVLGGKLEGVPSDRITDAVATHERVIVMARDRGLTLCVGSDYGAAEQHGTNLAEIAALIRAGLSTEEALLAATANGAQLMNDPSGGRIAPGYRADAVLLSADPAHAETFEDAANVAAVVKDGEVVYRR